MEALYEKAGLTDADVAAVRADLAARMRETFDAFVEQAVQRALALPGFGGVTAEVVRPNLQHSCRLYLESLEGDEAGRFDAFFREIALRRAREGVPPRVMLVVTDVVEALLRDLAARHISAPRELLAAALVAREVCDKVRSFSLDVLQQVQLERRAEIDRLVGQFSAPILPVLPGVLVLPVVGALSPARAGRILDALLAGIASHAAHTAIVDLTGLAEAEPTLAEHLNRIAAATQLLGARFVLVGVAPAVASLLVAAGARLGGVALHATLADALMSAARGGG